MLERFRRPRVILPTLAVLVLAAFVLLSDEADAPTTAGAISARVRSGRVPRRRQHHRRASRPRCRADPGPAEHAAGRLVSDQNRIARARRDGGEGGRHGRRARPVRRRREAPGSHARAPEGRGAVHAGAARLDAHLATAREDIRTLELGLEEKRIAKEQAKYEAPSIRRQAEIDYEKAERALRAGEGELQDQDAAGDREDARGGRGARASAQPACRSCRR